MLFKPGVHATMFGVVTGYDSFSSKEAKVV